MHSFMAILPFTTWAVPTLGFLYLRYGIRVITLLSEGTPDDSQPVPWRYCAPLLLSAGLMTVIVSHEYYTPGLTTTDPISVFLWVFALVFQLLLFLAVVDSTPNDAIRCPVDHHRQSQQTQTNPGETADDDRPSHD